MKTEKDMQATWLTRTTPGQINLTLLLAGATTFAHLQAGFFLPQGYEFALVMMVLSLVLVFTGGGTPSVDALLARGDDARHA